MESEDILKKIKRIEIKSKILSKYLSSGEYSSYFKGQGMSFSEVRNYQYGDEIRKIDWNVTARYHHPFVKLYEEEREQNVFILIDSTKSMFTGSNSKIKFNFLIELFAVLAFSAERNKDKISSILFTSKVEKYFPPKTGKKNILTILSSLLNFTSENQDTNIKSAIDFIQKVAKKRSVVFILSDYISDNSYYDALKMLKRKHDVILIKIKDDFDINFPDIGLVQYCSAENDDVFWIDTSDSNSIIDLKNKLLSEHYDWENFNNKEKISHLTIENNSNYISQLVKFFAERR